MQEDNAQPLHLPSLPAHARYLFHNNSCFDWGTYGWALDTDAVDTSPYEFIMFVNSSVRGPFLPPSWPVRTPCSEQP